MPRGRPFRIPQLLWSIVRAPRPAWWLVAFSGGLQLSACENPHATTADATGPLNLIENLPMASVGPDLVELDLGTTDSRQYLGHGWARNGQSPHRDFVWGLGQSSQLRVPLSRPGNVAVTVHARPFGGFDLHGQTVTLVANGQEFATIELEDGWSETTVVAPKGVFRNGDNTLECKYAWSAVPSDLSDSDDQRALAVAFDRFVFDPDAPAPGLSDDRPRAVDVDFGAISSRRQIGPGWGGLEQGPKGTTYAWAVARSASVTVDLGHPVQSMLAVRARPFVYPDAPSQSIDLHVNGTMAGTWILDDGWQEYTSELSPSMFKAGRNTLTLHFSRTNSPAAVGTGADDRTLAAALDWLSIEPVVSPTVQDGEKLHLALGMRTAYPVTLPAGSVLNVEMPEQQSSLVVELKDMGSARTQIWALDASGRIELTDAKARTRMAQLALIPRRGDQAASLVLDRVSVEGTGANAPTLIGLRPRSQASEADLPASP